MSKTISKADKRYREFIRDRFLEGFKAIRAYRAMCDQFEGKPCSVKSVELWYRRFRKGDLSLSDKPRSGRPFCLDFGELEKDIMSDPKQTLLELARKYECSRSIIRKTLKKNNIVRIENVWMKDNLNEERPPSPKPVIKREIVEKELNLEQKIYIVSRYYESGREYDKILKEFGEKFNVKTTEKFILSLRCVIEMFETAGSVKEEEVLYTALEEVDIQIKVEPLIDFETVIFPITEDFDDDLKPSVELPSTSNNVNKPKRIVKTKTLKSNYPRECPICKNLVSPSTYYNHLKRHSDSKPHVCEVCNRSFKLRKYLVSHLEVHKPASERKYWICQICGVKSTQCSNHSKHLKTAHPELYARDSQEIGVE